MGLYSVGYALFTTLSLVVVVRVAAVKILLDISPRYWMLRIFLPLLIVCAVASAIGYLPRFFMAESFSRLCVTTFLVEIALISLAWRILLDAAEREFLKSKVALVRVKIRGGI